MSFTPSKDGKTKYHINFDYRPEALHLGDIHLVQIGRRFTEGGAVIERHAHLNWFELTVVTRGGCTVITNGEEAEISAGDIYLSYPCDIHEMRADPGVGMEYDFFSFYTDGQMSEAFEQLTREHTGAGVRTFKNERIAYLVRTAISEFIEQRPYGHTVIGGVASQILAYVVRDFGEIKPSFTQTTKSDVLCQQIMSYIDTHIYSIEKLEEIADIFSYNYSYLSALFKKTTKMTIADYYRDRRLETARALLGEGKVKITEAAEMLGYSSPFAFSNAFKRKYGISPKSVKPTAGK